MTSALGVSALGVRPLAGTVPRAAPTTTVTAPTGALTTTTTTVSFTYGSDVGRTQHSYRYQIRSQDGSVVLYDSGTVESASTSAAVPYVLTGGSSYQMWVQVSDGIDLSEWAISSFSCESSDISGFTPNPEVGSVYEIGINGIGYMLADDPQNPVQRQLQQLNPPRLVTSDTPFSESFDRYTFVGQSDLSGGAGQKFLERDDSDPTRFWRSNGIDVFGDGITLLDKFPDVASPDSTRSLVRAWQGSSVITAGTNLSIDDGTPFTITGAGTIKDLTVGGGHWYATDGASIWRNTTGADPVTTWSTVNADLIEWCIDRLAAVYDDGTGNRCVTTFTPAGVEEVAGGRFKYPTSVEISDLAAGDGYLWFALNEPSGPSQVMFWQVGSADTYAANALQLPPGERILELFFYLGNLFVRTRIGTTVSIYRCVANEGRLTPDKVLEFDEPVTYANTRGFAGRADRVAFAWSAMVGVKPGIGIIDLTTGGWSTGPHVDGSTVHDEDVVKSLAATSAGWVMVTYDGVDHHLHKQGTTPVGSGQVDLSVSDLRSGLPKLFDAIELQFDPLPNGATVTVSYTLDGGISYTSAGTIDQDGTTSSSFPISVRGRSIGVRLGLTGSTPPVVNVVQVKLHASAPADQVIVLPINCSDSLVGVNGYPIPNELSAIERYHQLENLVSTRVLFQDVDWPVTGTTTVWEVVGVESRLHGFFSPTENRRVESGVAVVTMRKQA